MILAIVLVVATALVVYHVLQWDGSSTTIAAVVVLVVYLGIQFATAKPSRLICYEGGAKWKVHVLTAWPKAVCRDAPKLAMSKK